jgi:hypothetical protein
MLSSKLSLYDALVSVARVVDDHADRGHCLFTATMTDR